MKAKKFDALFNSGKNILKHTKTTVVSRPNQKSRRVNVDFPVWMIDSLDSEASRLGITRQSIIKVWVSDRLHQSKYQQ